MSKKEVVKPIALAVGIALAGSFAAVEAAKADTGASPFAMTTLSTAYMLGAGEGNCGGDKGGDKTEGGCGGDKEGGEEGHEKDMEASCGGDKEGDKDAEASCGGDKEGAEEGAEEGHEKDMEGSCGEGKCGGDF